jgi:hypothetical protein
MSDGTSGVESSDTHGVRRSDDELPVFANRLDMSVLSGNHIFHFGFSYDADSQAMPVVPPVLVPVEMMERLAEHFHNLYEQLQAARVQRLQQP